MLQLVIDWVGRQFGRPRVIEVRPSPSEMGFRFQREEFEKLFGAVGHSERLVRFRPGLANA